MDSNTNGKGPSSIEPVSEEEQKVLAIVQRKDNLPKELSIIIENYQHNPTKTNACSFLETFKRRLILLLVEDTYQEGFEWCPVQVRTAMEVFPNVLPYALRRATNHHIQDKEKMLSVLEKKDDLPHEMRSAIDCFKGDFVKSELTVPKQFLDYIDTKIYRFLKYRDERSQCRYDPHEFETMMRLFPYNLKHIESLVKDEYDENEYNPKAFYLVPMLLQLANDLGVFSCSNYDAPTNGLLSALLYEDNNYVFMEKACISILEDIINRKLISKEQIIERYFGLENDSFWRWCQNGSPYCSWEKIEYDNRFQYLVKLVPVESRERYFEKICGSNYYRYDEFYRYLEACLFWFPTEMGRLFLDKENELSNVYFENVSKYDPVVFELLEVHLAEATQETRLGMMAYAASNALVPRKFLHFLVRREVLQVVNGFEGTMQQSL